FIAISDTHRRFAKIDKAFCLEFEAGKAAFGSPLDVEIQALVGLGELRSQLELHGLPDVLGVVGSKLDLQSNLVAQSFTRQLDLKLLDLRERPDYTLDCPRID